METKQEELKREKREGNPAGTYFAVIALMVLLVLVGVYFLSVHASELKKSPVINQAQP